MRKIRDENKYFDERQLKIRGNIFLHAFVILVVLFLANALLGVVWMDDALWQTLLLIDVSLAACLIEMIVRDVYFRRDGRGRAAPYILPIVFMLQTLAGGTRESLTEGGKLTDMGARILIVILYFIVFATLVIKNLYSRRRTDDGVADDE